MVFSSPIFLFLFLPVLLAVHFFLPGIRSRNVWLLVGSIVFYAWGEPLFVILMLLSVWMNHHLGNWLNRETDPRSRKWAVSIAILINIGLLAFFKYSDFVVQNLNVVLGYLGVTPVKIRGVRLPIGISFFTFHALSYVLDVYRGNTPPARKASDVALYIFFFPQLIAGPIMRWKDIAVQLVQRTSTLDPFYEGIRRFILGLGKKVLIANTLAVPADQVFGLPAESLSPLLVWIGAICYALQIYFDFSGYSDMAVGLGKMFGFQFMENFNYPYTSQSVRDFWHRWHISLSTWFRDYLYVPLGGSRGTPMQTYRNLFIVFFLCGLWHGASWTFVIWGLYHGTFLVLERTRMGVWLTRLPKPARHFYALLVVLVGWVIFRAETLSHGVALVGTMFNVAKALELKQITELIDALLIVFRMRADTSLGAVGNIVTSQVVFACVAGFVFAMPAARWIYTELFRMIPSRMNSRFQVVQGWAEVALLVTLFIISAAWLADSTYNPFIYFRF